MSEDTKLNVGDTTTVESPPVITPTPPASDTEVKEAKVVKLEKTPTSGQSGPPIDLKWEKMNDKEQALIKFLYGSGTGARPIATISTLASECFFGKADTVAQANSWTRNSLRRLVRGEWVEKFVRGSFRITTKGRARLHEVVTDNT